MVIIRKDEIRNMTADERENKINELKTELLTLRGKSHTGAPESTGRIRELRKTIARILTISREEDNVPQ